MEHPLYQPFVSRCKGKKYSVYVKSKSGGRKLIHFGAQGYQHYHDRLGHYQALDHGDKDRRRRYRARHQKIMLRDGTPAYKNKNQAAYWSMKYLW